MNVLKLMYVMLLKVKHFKHSLLHAPYSLNFNRRLLCKLKIKYVVTVPIAALLLLFIFSNMDRNLTKDVSDQSVYVLQVRPAHVVASNYSDGGYSDPRMSGKLHCVEQRNVVYLKAIKCASETLTSIFRRFGYTRNLSFVLPPQDKIYLAWPYQMIKGTYRESKTGTFNIICEHAIYNRDTLRRLMPLDTVYVTSVREPFSQFKSMFHYYNFVGILKLKSDNPVREYLANISMYEAIYKSKNASATRYCIPDNLSMSQNLMSFNLGLSADLSHPGNSRKYSRKDMEDIYKWLDTLQQDFTMVIIVEYFVESLILLKRKLCWTWKDIFYMKLNNGTYTYSNLNDPELESIYKSWSKLDYLLYDSFNKTFWKQIRQQPGDFFDEVIAFKTAMKEGQQFCHMAKPEKSLYIVVPHKNWSPSFYITWSDCHHMIKSTSLLTSIKKRYDDLGANITQPRVPSNMTKVC